MSELAEVERAWLAEVGMRIRLGQVAREESQDRLAELARVSRVTVAASSVPTIQPQWLLMSGWRGR